MIIPLPPDLMDTFSPYWLHKSITLLKSIIYSILNNSSGNIDKGNIEPSSIHLFSVDE
jgi:hypothetical protein